MSFATKCPKCGNSLVGAKIEHQGESTWKAISDRLVRSGMLTGHVPLPPDIDLFYVVSVICPSCKAAMGDIIFGDSRNPVSCAEYRAKVARYKASAALTAEVLTAKGGDVQFLRSPDKPKKTSKTRMTVIYLPGVDHKKVDELVEEVGSQLVAAVNVQIDCGRPPEAMITSNGIHLHASSQDNARKQLGLK